MKERHNRLSTVKELIKNNRIDNQDALLEMLAKETAANGALSVQMTGSGPTLFALFGDRKTMLQAQETLQQTHSNFRIFTA